MLSVIVVSCVSAPENAGSKPTGSQCTDTRIAENGTHDPLYILSDHLGSTSTILDTNGNRVSRSGYMPWGWERFVDGAIDTDHLYTGQRLENDLDIYPYRIYDYYNARWYDPTIGRFLQADTMVPDPSNPLAYDRYTYGFNNPIMYTDPSGHFPLWPFVVGGAVFLGWGGMTAAHAYGLVPDYKGIIIANVVMDKKSDSTLVAAGIAVQSQWITPYDFISTNDPGHGMGISQVSWEQMSENGLVGDPRQFDVAIEAMAIRMDAVQNACVGCDATDLFIASALAQNGSGFTAGSMEAARRKDGRVDWEGVFSSYSSSTGYVKLREDMTGLQYDSQLQLLLFTKNYQTLLNMGWESPAGFENIDWSYIYSLLDLKIVE